MSPTLKKTDPLLEPAEPAPESRFVGFLAIAVVGVVALAGWMIASADSGPTSGIAVGAGGPAAAEIVAPATPPSSAPVTAGDPTDPDTAPAGEEATAPTGEGATGEIDGTTVDLEPGAVDDATTGGDGLADLAEIDETECVMEMNSLRLGSSGDSVRCLQRALADAGYLTTAITGEFDSATYAAVERLQTERNLFVDGVAGRETGLSLGIWPDEQMFVVRTPKPPAGATDLTGFPLSSVAASGPDAPPLPENSGSGRRVVYERISQRVWAVDENERVVRSWLVAGSQYPNEVPGTHYVYSRSEMSTAWNGRAYLPKMIRWLQTQRGHIGFHGIPYGVDDKKPYMTEDELGQRLSGGCQRQADLDAEFLWNFAPVGTKVVVL